MADPLPPCVCPHARYVSTEPSDPKLICGIMEADQQRADPIMEGAPVGIVISARDDPSTFFAWCTGEGQPTTDPDKPAMHYSACPVYAAAQEWNEMERLYGAPRPEPVPLGGGLLLPEELSTAEIDWLTDTQVR